jgi:hypothetical protein
MLSTETSTTLQFAGGPLATPAPASTVATTGEPTPTVRAGERTGDSRAFEQPRTAIAAHGTKTNSHAPSNRKHAEERHEM